MSAVGIILDTEASWQDSHTTVLHCHTLAVARKIHNSSYLHILYLHNISTVDSVYQYYYYDQQTLQTAKQTWKCGSRWWCPPSRWPLVIIVCSPSWLIGLSVSLGSLWSSKFANCDSNGQNSLRGHFLGIVKSVHKPTGKDPQNWPWLKNWISLQTNIPF